MLLLFLISLVSANFQESYYYVNNDCSGGLGSIKGISASCTPSALGVCTNSVKQTCVVTPSTVPANMSFVIRAHGTDSTCSSSLQTYTSSVSGCVRTGSSSGQFTCANGQQTWTQSFNVGCSGTTIDIVNNVGCSPCSTNAGYCFTACGTTGPTTTTTGTSTTSVSTTRTTTTSTSTTKPSAASILFASFILVFLAFVL